MTSIPNHSLNPITFIPSENTPGEADIFWNDLHDVLIKYVTDPTTSSEENSNLEILQNLDAQLPSPDIYKEYLLSIPPKNAAFFDSYISYYLLKDAINNSDINLTRFLLQSSLIDAWVINSYQPLHLACDMDKKKILQNLLVYLNTGVWTKI